ncbi:MAG: hypothetical protein HWE26_16590 [Alteromonadaceae bacterium]|nr:hypothetical protein [Alteromonadaceae bacterium]
MELILHIGTGKTGSTSIQSVLKDNFDDVSAQGVFFVGYMFDLLSEKRYAWQRHSGTESFNKLPVQQRKKELKDILAAAQKEAIERGCTKILWSNEALCNMPRVAEFIDSIWHDKVTVIAYVRRHDAYAVSAYKQWGLKHKIYSGELLSFSEFTNRFPLTFYDRLIKWQRRSWKYSLINYDKCGNVVDHFLSYTGVSLPAERASARQNTGDSLGSLLFKAIVNTAMNVPPSDTNFTVDSDMTIRDEDWFFDKLPTPEDVDAIFERTREDREKLNSLLVEADHFNEDPPNFRPYTREDVKQAYKVVFSMLVDKVINMDEQWRKQYRANAVAIARGQHTELAELNLRFERLHREVAAHNAVLTRLSQRRSFRNVFARIKRKLLSRE